MTAEDPDKIKILDPTVIFGNPIVGALESGNKKISWIAVDAMANGDIWTVRRDNSGDSLKYKLVRFAYLADDPYYQIDTTTALDITADVGTGTDIFDIAINQSANYLYLFQAGEQNRGVIQSYQLVPGSHPVHKAYYPNILSEPMKYDSDVHTGFAGYGDIDIDHVDSSEEPCRILVYGRLQDYSSELVRLDSNFNVLDRKHFTSSWPGFAINPASDVSKRNLVMPDTGTVAFWTPPADW